MPLHAEIYHVYIFIICVLSTFLRCHMFLNHINETLHEISTDKNPAYKFIHLIAYYLMLNVNVRFTVC
jgi:hypothetical protein